MTGFGDDCLAVWQFFLELLGEPFGRFEVTMHQEGFGGLYPQNVVEYVIACGVSGLLPVEFS